ncbi:MAG: preprotein translocase subunit YajC [Candidatus Aminicenantes bacterium]|nr:preprotein translocase subunit YajC [Candidatus Aminicenantes bacterium]
MIFSALFAAAQAQPSAGQPMQGNMLTALLPFVLVFGIFYVLIILPQRKKQKKHMEAIEGLKPGDKIITTGGMFGTVMGVLKDRIELKIAANVKIEVTKGSVGVILSQGETQPAEKSEA